MSSPLYQYGIVETTSHYLLHYPLYIAHRDVMLDFVRLITADSTITNITTELTTIRFNNFIFRQKQGNLLQSVHILNNTERFQ